MDLIKDALLRIHSITKKNKSQIVHTHEITRADRELLIKNHWLEEIIRGWYLVIRPDLRQGDSTAWYASFWDFLRVYLSHHYGNEYCLSAESSLDVLTGNSVIPKQIIVIAPRGSGTPLQLPHNTSLLVYADPARLPEERESVEGLQVMTFAYALCKVSINYFQSSPKESEIALRSFSNPSELLRVISQYNFKNAADRLVGAYRFLQNNKMAEELKNSLESVGMAINEKNPFLKGSPVLVGSEFKSSYTARIHMMWEQFRLTIIDLFPKPPGLPKDISSYLQEINEIYEQDAYNSLSIEGYHVSEVLIEKVKNKLWNPEQNPEDQQQRDALAARGYWEAFLLVKESVEKILKGATPGSVIRADLPKWYRKLFLPSVQAGILPQSDLFGYRKHQVYIRGSRHTPPAKENLIDTMDTLFDLLEKEDHPAVRALLGHFIFVYIHPYMDGNGRLARFLMNSMLASGGYPWTVIQVIHRSQYFASLESASVKGDIHPFTQFILNELHKDFGLL